MFINNIPSNNNNADVSQSWEKIGTMGVSSRAGVMSLIFKKVNNAHVISNFRLQNLHYNSQELHVRNFRSNNS